MPSETTPLLDLPLIQPAQAQKHVTHNEALSILESLVQIAVESRAATAPPVLPDEGTRHLVAAGATGAWAGRDGDLAVVRAGGWSFHAPAAGWVAWIADEARLLVHDGTDWADPAAAGAALGLDRLGINATPDGTNRLAVAAAATLFSHDGAGHRLTVNKAAAGDTAALLFQDGWSGRAEMGLAGTDDWSLKVSADGAAWTEALRIARATGLATGAAVQGSAGDATAGRLMTVGAFGLGTAALPDASADATGHVTRMFRATSGTRPDGNNWHLLHLSRVADAQSAQFGIADLGSGSPPLAAVRHRASGGSWSAWNMLFGRTNLLGTVSQSGGVPTGAAIETGSNASGRYLRLADGTQICWQVLATSAAGEATATFPAAFASTAGLATALGINTTANTALSPRFTNRSVTGLDVSVFNAANTRVATQVEIVSTGRWF